MNKSIPSRCTYGQKYGPAMEVTTKQEATEYFSACVEDSIRHGLTREEAEKLERINIGYWAGYYSDEIRRRVEELYGFVHPYLGSVDSGKDPFKTGFELGWEDLNE